MKEDIIIIFEIINILFGFINLLYILYKLTKCFKCFKKIIDKDLIELSE